MGVLKFICPATGERFQPESASKPRASSVFPPRFRWIARIAKGRMPWAAWRLGSKAKTMPT